jgi:phosphoserine phosphatase RsbU/P
MLSKIHISLKYKFLGVMMLVLLSSLGVFFGLAQDTFSEDKKLFVMDLNRTLLKATTSEIKLELRGRMEELQVFVPRVYRATEDKIDPFTGLSEGLRNDLLGVTFYKKDKDGYKALRWYLNPGAAQENQLAGDFLTSLHGVHPIDFSKVHDEGTQILNRSVKQGDKDITVLTFVLSGSFLNDQSAELVIVVDLLQRFLLKQLQQSEIAEVFLIFKDGRLLSHPSLSNTVEYSAKQFPHPITQNLNGERFSRESLELDVNGEAYLCNISETGFKDIFAVSQTRKSEAFLALQTLLHKSALLAILVLSAAVFVSVFFAAGLTSNIQKLRRAAEQIGAGNLNVKLNVNSNDEIRSVAKSFQWMVNRLQTLIEESLEKARLADELETARLVQSTLLTPPEVATDAVKVLSHYVPATECGGDYWDAHFDGRRVTVFIGDATGHGAPAAIVTAVAKSCFATITTFASDGMTPEEMLNIMNRIIYSACRGKLLMTMCVVQLDAVTGELTVANAGHEAPMCLRKSAESILDAKERRKKAVETFFAAQGERLGFDPLAQYASEKVRMDAGDIVLLYTDGISEAKNVDGKEWGERALKKVFSARGNAVLDEIREALVTGVQLHTGEAVQEDDITFVLLEYQKALAVGSGNPLPEGNRLVAKAPVAFAAAPVSASIGSIAVVASSPVAVPASERDEDDTPTMPAIVLQQAPPRPQEIVVVEAAAIEPTVEPVARAPVPVVASPPVATATPAPVPATPTAFKPLPRASLPPQPPPPNFESLPKEPSAVAPEAASLAEVGPTADNLVELAEEREALLSDNRESKEISAEADKEEGPTLPESGKTKAA